MPRSSHRNGARKGSVKSRSRSDFAFPAASPAATALTPSRASAFVKLMHAGLPADQAVGYILPDCKEPRKLASTWANNPLTLDATVAFNKGAWEELEPESRLILARDKFLAEQAYFLYTHSFGTLADEDRGKAKYAYESICEYLKGLESIDDPIAKFLSEMKLTVEKAGPTPDATVDVGDDIGAPLPLN